MKTNEYKPSKLTMHARRFAIKHHSETNHKYDGQSYTVHLALVYEYAIEYRYLLDNSIMEAVIASAWTHDLIEDCRLTYNDIKKELGETIAEITYALTNEKGKNRRERANEKYYAGIRATPGAAYIKVCDRMANVLYSKTSINGSMFDMYKKENENFEAQLLTRELEPMFIELRNILK